MEMVEFDPKKLLDYLESLNHKYKNIENQLSDVDIISNQVKLRDLSKELSNLRPLSEKYGLLARLLEQRDDAENLISSSEDDEMKELAREEVHTLSDRIEGEQEEIFHLLASDHREDNRNVFLEIRAGVGGDEASLFASDLLRMYSRTAEQKRWKAEVISTTYSSIGGIKEIILHIKGAGVHRYLRFESGVHRVQRVPVTEASGRIHTSTVTVAVMPEVEEVEVGIQTKDIRIDTFAASGPGGQHVNRTYSAIRLTHLPTGIVVTCQDEKSQHKNKDKAMKVLTARLYEIEMSKQKDDLASQRKSQVGSGERSEKIRTYNFPQSRLTDHRISGRNFNLETTLDGNLNDIVALLTEDYTRKYLEDKFKQIIA